MWKIVLLTAATALAVISVSLAQTTADGASAPIQPSNPPQSAPENSGKNASAPALAPVVPAQQLKRSANPNNTAPLLPDTSGELPVAAATPQIIIPPIIITVVLNGNPAVSAPGTDPYSTLANSMNLYVLIVTLILAGIVFLGYRRISDIKQEVEEYIIKKIEQMKEEVIKYVSGALAAMVTEFLEEEVGKKQKKSEHSSDSNQ